MTRTKLVIVVRDDIAGWKSLNVVAFLMSGIVGRHPELIGDAYRDRSGIEYLPLATQPVFVLAASADGLRDILDRARQRRIRAAIYIEDMFVTSTDETNRATVLQYSTEALPLVGVALLGDGNVVDKATKLARRHP